MSDLVLQPSIYTSTERISRGLVDRDLRTLSQLPYNNLLSSRAFASRINLSTRLKAVGEALAGFRAEGFSGSLLSL